MTFALRPPVVPLALVVPDEVAAGAAVDVSRLDNVTLDFDFGDFVGVVMPQITVDGTNWRNVLETGLSASRIVALGAGVVVQGVRANTTTATSGDAPTCSILGRRVS